MSVLNIELRSAVVVMSIITLIAVLKDATLIGVFVKTAYLLMTGIALTIQVMYAKGVIQGILYSLRKVVSRTFVHVLTGKLR